MRSPIVFLDMDGVLSDFNAGRHALLIKSGILPPDTPLPREYAPPAGFPPESVVWDLIRSTPEFWSTLPALPWAKQLLISVEVMAGVFGCEWFIATSPYLDPAAGAGKLAWLQLHAPGFQRSQLILLQRKHVLSGPDRLLIDDDPVNVGTFQSGGGRTVLFPAYHNHRRAELEHPDLMMHQVIGESSKLLWHVIR